MKKTAHRKKATKDRKLILTSKKYPFSFWNFVRTTSMTTLPYLEEKYNMIPHEYEISQRMTFQKKIPSLYLHKTRRTMIDKIKMGSMLACVLTSKNQLWFPVQKKTNEIIRTKIRTFFGHLIQQRNRKSSTSILLRVLITGEPFLFRLLLYAPNIISVFPVFNFKGQNRSCFLFKVARARKALLLSKKNKQ